MDFFNKQQDFMKDMVAANPDDPFWRNAGLILSQYSGLVDGYHHAAPEEMVSHALLELRLASCVDCGPYLYSLLCPGHQTLRISQQLPVHLVSVTMLRIHSIYKV